MKMILILLIFLSSCGINHKISGNVTAPDVKVKVEPSFDRAIEICDNRYGPGTEEAEACFKDYRNYYDVEIKFNVASIVDFCKNNYTNPTDVRECVKDLSAAITKGI